MALGRNLFPIFIVRSLLILTLSLVSVAQVLENCDNGYGNYTKGSRYEANLNNLLSSLHSHIDPFGFANSTSSSGEGDSSDDDPAYALFLCRGDIDHDSCTKCVNDTVSKLTTTCPGYKQASGTYDGCMLRYSNRSLTGSVAANIFLYMKYPVNATNVAQFNQELGALMTDLRTKASKGGSSLKFAAANKTISDFQTLYGLVQCTPDLTEQQCNNCLLDRIAQIPDCCAGNTMGGVFAWSCYMQFQTSPFYNETRVLERLSPPPPSPGGQGSPPPIPSPPPHLPEPAGNNNTNQSTLRRIVAISISTVVGFIFIIFLCFIVIIKKKMAVMSPDQKPDSSMNDDTSSTETMQYEFKTIQEATDDFSDANRLGHGGFGVVYKGRLSNGKEIAVKRLAEGSEQGKTEFKNEIVLMSRLNHRNLTKLLGFCLQGKERLIVYEFLPNRSLDHFIFHPVRRMLLNWETRYNIIVGVARGLVYLHEGSSITIIHHDLKASNVLLDEKMNPRISDFGMARLFTVDKSLEITKKIAGT
ncbi:cysteine-rich receptor-like protein kinase 25 [Impatiens glandulifera]|uniref:cysteine-rich receptor-like protein kinase 25 n=1 Tax=Impatiens glandulifera TaxID=253017 RepID=UPI001FB0AADC|nr:cysteine-rich receptor-like protein kinase 25 [Impatiens glandulifera]